MLEGLFQPLHLIVILAIGLLIAGPKALQSISRNAGTGQCSKIRAYESCMKSKGYITVLGPENPSGCGDPAWESDVRKWLK